MMIVMSIVAMVRVIYAKNGIVLMGWKVSAVNCSEFGIDTCSNERDLFSYHFFDCDICRDLVCSNKVI